MCSAPPDDARVRSINRIKYVGKPFDNGVLWRGGIIGGDVWVRNGSKRFTLDVAATKSQHWARRTYHESREYIELYRKACAEHGIRLDE
ncbi:hypothetical protein GCM10010869_16430 [Mesorhizobium tianshanense]|uniref:Uncharacterized protein n=1 Tax=Mesorhizobium tianshanense TaxID=39844 RepID=A0A562NXF5_9HYPH|nr:hypothetical protein [Mesorhizobium tianshanense]TWI36406.1 hypothetical protein IQ26_02919 [Mesorhizobium tianshanense]GLS36054.1 hypothetical protein GCM10010869_16430 [Mesorhizobium tianshanense]